MATHIDNDTADLINTVVDFAAQSRKQYADSKELTTTDSHGCETIRVPVALLNRIRDLGIAIQSATSHA